MESNQRFELVLDKKYIAGFDPYELDSESESFGAIVLTKPRQQFSIKRINGFKRVVSIGWSYIVEFIK